jgi:hypothetical protein
MKRLFIIGVIFFAGIQPGYSQADITGIIKAGIKKVIVAVDLKIQRLQNKTIWLQNAQKAIENTMSKVKLTEISDWTERQKTLYKDYFDELWKVKNIISYYNRIKDITAKQLRLVEAYKKAYSLFKQDNHFTPGEIDYMGKVYSGILDESAQNLDQILMVINSFSLQISDAKRLEIIDGAANAIEQNYTDLVKFNHQNMGISMQRSKDLAEVNIVKSLYGIK